MPSPNNFLRTFWNCPFDSNPLQIVVNQGAQNQFFVINRTNISMGIQNAIAMREISLESYTQTEQLANYIFSNNPANELTFVSTSCSVCHRTISAPKI